MNPPNSIETISSENTIADLLKAETPEAADALQTLSLSTENKEARKAAKRALYLLSQKGIKPSALPVVAKSAPSLSAPADRITQTLATLLDGAGNQLLWFIFADPDGGSPTLLSVLTNDEVGIKDFVTMRQSRREIQQRIEATAQESMAGMAGVSFAEVSLEHNRTRMATAQALTRRLRQPTPPGFLDWAKRVGEPTQPAEDSSVYSVLSREEIAADTEINRDANAFFVLPLFESWFLDVQTLAGNAFLWGQVMGAFPSEPKPDRETILKNGVREGITESVIEDYRARLEETAYILHANGQTEIAKMALVHALTLTENVEATENTFLLTLTERSLGAAVGMLQNALQEQLMQAGQGVQTLR